MSKATKQGFTIIELLVVIAIIGLISSVVLVSMKGSTGKAKIAKSLEFSQTILNTTGYDAVGVWSFDEGSGGTAYDKSGYGNHGTLVGPPTWVKDDENTPHWYVNQHEGRSALDFSIGNNYVNCGGNSSLDITDKTVEFWVNTPSFIRSGIIGRQHLGGGGSTKGFGFFWENGNNLTWWIGDGSANHQSLSTSLTYNKWIHLVGVHDHQNGKIELYKNGKNIGEKDVSGYTSPSSDLLIGAYATSWLYFNGKIDEVRIYARSLSSSEIQQHYAAGAEKHEIALK